jgi:hypothetical protein
MLVICVFAGSVVTLACWAVGTWQYRLGWRCRGEADARYEQEHGHPGLYQGCGECGATSRFDVLYHEARCPCYRAGIKTTRISRFTGGSR